MGKVYLTIFCLFFSGFLQAQQDPKVTVEYFYPQQEPYIVELELSGTIWAKQDALLSPLAAGVVRALFVEAGDIVQSGQRLLTLDDSLAKLQLIQAKAELNATKINLKEAKRQHLEVVTLAKSKVVSDSLLAERTANLASSEAQLSNAQARVNLQQEIVNRHTLVAPFSGIIASRNVDLGEWISQQNEVFQLVSNERLHLRLNLPQEHLSTIARQKDITVLVIPDTSPEKQITLPITSIIQVTDPTSRASPIRVDLPANLGLTPGTSARARMTLSNSEKLLTWVPRSALKRHPDGESSIFVIENNRLKRYQIKIKKTDNDQIAVIGLPKNPAVVISGTELLLNDQSVNAKEKQGAQ